MQTRLTSYRGTVGTTYEMLCNDSGNTAEKNGNRGKRTSDRARTQNLHTFTGVSHEPSVPAVNPSSPIALVLVAGVPLSSDRLLGP